MGYYDVQLETPSVFKGAHKGSSVLIISNGPSAKFVLENKQLCRDRFDVIITTNHGFKDFEDIADYHLCTEKTSPTNKVPEMLNSGSYRTDLPRIFNWKGIETYDSKYNLFKTTRLPYQPGFYIMEYEQNNGQHGLFTGPVNSRNMATGSVTLQCMHLSAIFGAKEIFLIGADLIFRGEHDHYYPDNQYRDPEEQGKLKPKNRVHIVEVEHEGKTYQTTDYFRDSAECLDDMITGPFVNIPTYDFSNGLVSKAIKLDVNNFFVQGE